jgi:hypothetical protein
MPTVTVKGKPILFYIYLGITGGEKGLRFFCQIVDTDDNFKILHDFEIKIKSIDNPGEILEGITELLEDFKFNERFVIVAGDKSNIEWENGRMRNADGSIDTACLRVGQPVAMFLISYFPIDREWDKPEYEVVLPYDLQSLEQRKNADLNDPLLQQFQGLKRRKRKWGRMKTCLFRIKTDSQVIQNALAKAGIFYCK